MKDFTVVLAVVLFVIGGLTYNDYTEFCNCIEKLENEVALYNENALREMHKSGMETRTKDGLLSWKAQQEPKADWLLAALEGELPNSLGDMHDAGIPVGMFDIAREDEYWSIDRIRVKFKDKNGVERKDLFHDFYEEQYDRYMAYRVGELSLLNYNTAPNITANKSSIKTPQAVIYKTKPDPWHRSYSSMAGWTTGTLNEQCKTENVILKFFGVENHF